MPPGSASRVQLLPMLGTINNNNENNGNTTTTTTNNNNTGNNNKRPPTPKRMPLTNDEHAKLKT